MASIIQRVRSRTRAVRMHNEIHKLLKMRGPSAFRNKQEILEMYRAVDLRRIASLHCCLIPHKARKAELVHLLLESTSFDWEWEY